MVATRKDFIRTAEVLARTKASNSTINGFVNSFKNDNPKFDEKRFRAFLQKKKEDFA